MRLNCPVCGARDLREFSYLGDAVLCDRPSGEAEDMGAMVAAFHDYVHLRKNPAGAHRELWQHVFGCGLWLRVTRDTASHDVMHVETVS